MERKKSGELNHLGVADIRPAQQKHFGTHYGTEQTLLNSHGEHKEYDEQRCTGRILG